MKNELPCKKTPAWEARSNQDIFFSLYCNKMLLIRRKEKVRTELKTQIFIRSKEEALHSQVYIT